jgi:ABC-type Fe3+-hydroxamate transport system substrate-binding protein
VLKRLKAVQNKRVYSVDSNLFVRPTPRLLKGLELLQRIIVKAQRG